MRLVHYTVSTSGRKRKILELRRTPACGSHPFMISQCASECDLQIPPLYYWSIASLKRKTALSTSNPSTPFGIVKTPGLAPDAS